jgi:hypothetical protein
MMGLPQIRRSTYSVCFDFDAMQPCAGRSGGIFNVGPIYSVSYGDGWVIHCRCRNTVFKGLSLTWAPRHKGRNLRTPPPTDRPWRKYWGKKQFVFIFQIVSPATRHSWRVYWTRAITSILPDRKSFLVCLDSHLVLFFYI